MTSGIGQHHCWSQ